MQYSVAVEAQKIEVWITYHWPAINCPLYMIHQNCDISVNLHECEGGKKMGYIRFLQLGTIQMLSCSSSSPTPMLAGCGENVNPLKGPNWTATRLVKTMTWHSLAWCPPDVFRLVLIQPSPIGENHLLIIHIFFYSISSLSPSLSHPAEFTHLCSLPLWLLGTGARTCSPPAWQQRYSLCPATSKAPHAQGTSRKVVGVDGEEGYIYAVFL